MRLAFKETVFWAVGLSAVAGLAVLSQVSGVAAQTRAALPAAASASAAIAVLPGMPPVVDPRNLYSETAAG